MKKIINSFGVVLLVFTSVLLSGCHQKKELKIGFLYPSKDIVRYYKECNYFKNYAENEGVEVIVKDASNDESLQLAQAKELISQGVNALVVIAVNVNTAVGIVRESNENDIPIMAYNRMIENSDLDFFVGSNSDLIGKVMVDAVIKEKPRGNFVILGGDKFDKNGEDLQVAIKKYLKPHIENGNVNIVYETFIEQWSSEVAAFEMEKVVDLYGVDIDAVFAGFDGMADGVINVLKKHSMEGKVAVTGQDAEIRGCKNIINGMQTVTVFHPLKKGASKAAEIAIKLVKGESVDDYKNSSEFNGLKDVSTYRVNSVAVTKDNIDEVLISSGFYKKEELYN
jgi:D-xylose transport system substrate-binding protein